MGAATRKERHTMPRISRTPRIEVLFGPTARGFDEALCLREGRQTYVGLLETLYLPEDLENAEELAECEILLDKALAVLLREGFVHEYPVGDAGNRWHWWYQLTPVGLDEVRKVQIVQDGSKVWWRAVGTDGKLYQRGEQVLEDDEE